MWIRWNRLVSLGKEKLEEYLYLLTTLYLLGTGAGIYILDAGDLSLVNHIATELDLCDLVFLPDSHLVLANES